jgi:hypothetical protein
MVFGVLKKKRECVKAFQSQDIIIGFLKWRNFLNGQNC